MKARVTVKHQDGKDTFDLEGDYVEEPTIEEGHLRVHDDEKKRIVVYPPAYWKRLEMVELEE